MGTRPQRPAQTPTALTEQQLRAAIDDAVARYDELLEAERFGQAADALAALIDRASQTYGPDSDKVLGLRQRVAAAHELGNEHRKGRREYDSLAEAYVRVNGRLSEDSWDCRAGSARCRMALGNVGSSGRHRRARELR